MSLCDFCDKAVWCELSVAFVTRQSGVSSLRLL